MTFFKYFKKNKVIYIIAWLVLSVYILLEIINISTDIYNLNQIEKMIDILRSVPKDRYHFRTLQEFNNNLNLNIKPKWNCYFVIDTVNYKWYTNKESLGYIIWFGFKSELMKLYYWEWYYVYPKYDLPKTTMCTNNYCYDSTFLWFQRTILTACSD